MSDERMSVASVSVSDDQTGVDERPSVASVSVSDERMSVGERMSVASMRDECRMVCCLLG